MRTGLAHERELTSEMLFRWSNEGDEAARSWLVDTMSQGEFAQASRLAGHYTIITLVFGLVLLPWNLRGFGGLGALLAFIPLLVAVDRKRRRASVYRALVEGERVIYRKLELREPEGGHEVFRSYWTSDGAQRLELDHHVGLLPGVREADEWWQWRMTVPQRNGYGHIGDSRPWFDIGLVRRDGHGRAKLLVAGTVYHSYDPWTGRSSS